MVPFNFRKQLSYIYIGACILNLFLLFAVVSWLKAIGVGLVVLLTETFVMVSQLIFLKKRGIDPLKAKIKIETLENISKIKKNAVQEIL